MDEQIKVARAQFIAFMIIGTAFIIVGSFPDSPWWGGIFSIGFPNALILFYAGSNYRKNRAFAQEQTFADSTYYMGFLLTIVALTVALVKFGINQNSSTQFASLLQQSMVQFGTALITTIVGMACRITLVGFKSGAEQDIAGRLAAEERLVEEAIRNLRTRMIDFDHILESANNEFNQNINRRTTQAMDEINAVVQTIKGGAEETIQLLSEGTQTLTDSLNDAIQESTKAFQHLQKSIEFPGNNLSAVLQKSATSVQQAGSAFDAAASQARQRMEAVPKTMDEAADLSLQAAEQFQKAATLFETKAGEMASSINKAIAACRDVFENLKGDTANIISGQARASEAIAQSVQLLKSAQQEMKDALQAASQIRIPDTRGLNESIEHAHEEVRQLTQRANSALPGPFARINHATRRIWGRVSNIFRRKKRP